MRTKKEGNRRRNAVYALSVIDVRVNDRPLCRGRVYAGSVWTTPFPFKEIRQRPTSIANVAARYEESFTIMSSAIRRGMPNHGQPADEVCNRGFRVMEIGESLVTQRT